jgi:replicative DNA helicase
MTTTSYISTNITNTAPYNIEAEQTLLGAILVNNEVLNRVTEFLRSEHFYEPIHIKIYDAINLILDKGISASPISLANMLGNDDQFKSVGGTEYLSKLVILATTVINAQGYAKIIYDLAIRRQLIGVGEEIVTTAYNSGLDYSAAEQIETAENKLFNLASEGISDKGFIGINDTILNSIASIDRAMKNSDHITGTTTGFVDLDTKLSGFQNSDLVILAARPSMGKTALLINFALDACKALVLKNPNKAKNEIPSVGVFSLEMSAEQLSTRMLSMNTKIDSSALKSGKVNEQHYNELRKQAQILADLPFYIDDTPALTIAAIRTRARRLKRKHNLAILFIDYLQLIRGSSNTAENRVLEVSQITQGLKALAKELNIPIIAASQLSRAVEQREDKRPMLSDLRESGSIEQDSDIVMFIYREEYYLARRQPEQGTEKHSEWLNTLNKVHNLAEIIVAKHRNGPVGTVQLFYDGRYSLFKNYNSLGVT